ncbi:MAG: amino acid ABC transporter substrate-binding protein [Slackia sp.]|nr:amino acid ABC transporter substrate-binding protein [Slackia sp.]
MKRKIALIIATAAASVLSMVLLAGCSGPSASDQPAAAPAAGEDFVVGFDQSYPPYGFVGDNGEYTGFDLDLAAEVAKRNGWNVRYEAIDWDAKDTLLKSGAITCIWNGFTMEGREDKYTFSEPYMLNGQVVVVKKGKGIESFDDLAGKTVITQVDSAALDVLEGDKASLAATFGRLDTIGDYNTAFMQLESGAVDAVACDLSIAQYQMTAKPDAYVMLDETLSSEHYAVGFKPGNDETAEKVSLTLKEMYEDGTVEALCEKYAEYGLSFDNWLLK